MNEDTSPELKAAEQSPVEEKSENAAPATIEKTADPEQVRQLIDRAVQEFVQAHDSGNSERRDAIAKQIQSNPELIPLFQQRLQERRRIETSHIENFKKETREVVLARARRFFEPITQNQRQKHVLESRIAEESQQRLHSILGYMDSTTTLPDLFRAVVQLQTWVDSFSPAVSIGYGRAQESAGRAREHLDGERTAARLLTDQLKETPVNYKRLQQKLRPQVRS